MRYFLVEEDKNYVNRVKVRNWTKKISAKILYNKSYFQIPKRIVMEIEPNPKTDFVDFIMVPFLMVSEKVKKVIDVFEPNMQYREIVLLDKKYEKAEVYYLPILKEMDCLGKNTVFNLDHSIIKKPVLNRGKAEDKSIFRLAEGPASVCVVRMDLLECLLRREAYGFQISEPEYEQEGEE